MDFVGVEGEDDDTSLRNQQVVNCIFGFGTRGVVRSVIYLHFTFRRVCKASSNR
jgi:hypothetical protein